MRRVFSFLVTGVMLVAGACTSSGSDTAPTPGRSRPLATPGQLAWRTLKDMPDARQEVGTAVVGDKIWAIGGLTAKGATDHVDIYDTVSDTWAPGPALPAKLHHVAAAAIGENIWVIGGFDAANTPVRTVYRLSAGKWASYLALNEARAASGAVVVNGSIYVAGGQGIGHLVAPVEVLIRPTVSDRGQWLRLAAIPTPRHHVGVATDGKDIFVSAGRVPTKGGGPDHNIAVFEKYDVTNNQWTRLPDVPTARSGHGSVFFRGFIAVFGGEDPTSTGFPSIAITEEFDLAKKTWTRTLPPMFRARHGFAIAVIGDALFTAAGGTRSGLAPTEVADKLAAS